MREVCRREVCEKGAWERCMGKACREGREGRRPRPARVGVLCVRGVCGKGVWERCMGKVHWKGVLYRRGVKERRTEDVCGKCGEGCRRRLHAVVQWVWLNRIAMNCSAH